MVVSLKYFEKQWRDVSAYIGIANVQTIFHIITFFQFTIQLLSIAFLIFSYFIHWRSKRNENSMNFLSTEYEGLCFSFSLLLLLCDVVFGYISYILRKATSLHGDLKNIQFWIIANNLFFVAWMVCYIVISPKGGILEIYNKGLIFLYASFKLYFMIQLYGIKNKTFEVTGLDNNTKFLNHLSKLSNSVEDQPLPKSHIIDTEKKIDLGEQYTPLLSATEYSEGCLKCCNTNSWPCQCILAFESTLSISPNAMII